MILKNEGHDSYLTDESTEASGGGPEGKWNKNKRHIVGVPVIEDA